MRLPVALALAIPVLAIVGVAGVYHFSRTAGAQRRTYYIAADELVASPSGGSAAASSTRAPERYKTAVYREYTDATFSREKPRRAPLTNLEMVGPLIRAAVGDTVSIVFRNRLGIATGIHADPLRMGTEAGPGAAESAGPGWRGDDSPVPPGGQRVYRWPVPESAGPSSEDHGSTLWVYHTQMAGGGSGPGLFGPMIIYGRGAFQNAPQP